MASKDNNTVLHSDWARNEVQRHYDTGETFWTTDGFIVTCTTGDANEKHRCQWVHPNHFDSQEAAEAFSQKVAERGEINPEHWTLHSSYLIGEAPDWAVPAKDGWNM